MNTESCVLIYNMEQDDRTRKIRRFLHHQGIRTKPVSAQDYLRPVGSLLELPGFPSGQILNLGQNFSEEMLLMYGMTDLQLDLFLAFFRENNLPGVALKAMITMVNRHWNSMEIYQELKKEHDRMHR